MFVEGVNPHLVHPRPRGEHPITPRLRCDVSGSSPPTRGTPTPPTPRTFFMRFIPAHAGNTALGCFNRYARSVHPRPRGEHLPPVFLGTDQSGSSPPTRGTPARSSPARTGSRFIPAHAGNTVRISCNEVRYSVHPRPRGEHLIGIKDGNLYSGSSPPTRGTRKSRNDCSCLRRFIPAHAGNTPRLRSGDRKTAVHPRPRGEHNRAAEKAQTINGSSPPTRGTLLALPVLPLVPRFIPAHAGNT